MTQQAATFTMCGTNRRKLWMWEIGVNDEKFKPHTFNEACTAAGCVPLTRGEFLWLSTVELQNLSHRGHILDILQQIFSFENMTVEDTSKRTRFDRLHTASNTGGST